MLFMWYHDGIQEKVIIMNIDMKYLTVDAPKNAMMLWAIMAFGILAVVFNTGDRYYDCYVSKQCISRY